jgi:glucose/arabinose dehydrogenase
MVTTVAGQRLNRQVTGKDSTVKFDNPVGIAVDDTGNVYVADWNNDVIRKINPVGRVTLLAGGIGPGLKNAQGGSALFYLPRGIALDAANNLYVADSYNNMIRKITPGGMVTTVAGKVQKGKAKIMADGPGAAATFFRPSGVAADKQGNIYVADMGSGRIRKITQAGMVSTLAGNGKQAFVNGCDTTASFFRPYGVAVDKTGKVYVADYDNNVVRKISY